MPINVFSPKKVKASLTAIVFLMLFVLMPGGVASADTKPDGAKVSESTSCKNYKDDAKKACSFGYNASLGAKGAARAQKNEVPTKSYSGEESADAAAQCAKYKVSSNKNACVKGYKDGHYAYYHKTDHSPLVKSPTRTTSLTPCPPGGKECSDPAANPSADCGNEDCDFIRKFINPAINTLSACFGIIAVISLILGGINYSTSEGDPQKTSRAKNRIYNTIIAVVAYLFLWSFLQFLVPGGAFK